MIEEKAVCELCGEPMPPGEQMFKFHGYSGPCPNPPLPRKEMKRYIQKPPTQEEVSAVIKRFLTDWDRASKTVDISGNFRIEFVTDLCILADAYMHEHGIEQPDVFATVPE